MIWRGRRHKYGAVRTADGFPSRLEAAVNQLLELRVRAGEIRNLRRQVRVELTDAAIACKIDFAFEDVATGEERFAEAKGVETDRWKLIKKLWTVYGPAPCEIWRAGRGGPQLDEIVTPKPRQAKPLAESTAPRQPIDADARPKRPRARKAKPDALATNSENPVKQSLCNKSVGNSKEGEPKA